MTRIDFFSNVPDKLSYACRLARKAYGARARVIVLTENNEQSEALNAALWNVSDTDFIPHVLAGDPLAPQTPIVITHDENATLPHHDVLVNLTRRVPNNFQRFARLCEIISSEDVDAAEGRKRYAAYRKESYPLTHAIAGQS